MEKYLPSHRMREIIADNHLLLMTLSRFGLSLGFGEATVEQVCAGSGVDCSTFLAVANHVSGKPAGGYNVSVRAMLAYLRCAHVNFLDYVLPAIRRKLIEAINHNAGDDVSMLVIRFFDGYVAEIKAHMDFENDTVFPYVDGLLSGNIDTGYSISDFTSHHQPIENRLHDLKEILVGHYRASSDKVDAMNSVLYDIVTCECDIRSHCRIEDELFAPAVSELEKSVSSPSFKSEAVNVCNVETRLSQREKDIIAEIAKGFSNKEVGDRLCISPHTVATHRRNIQSKLDIHSAQGLTLYAIIHNLINVDDIRL